MLGCLLAGVAQSQVTFSVTPSVISNNYAGFIKLQVTGLPAGHAVVLRKYLDQFNTGSFNPGADLLMWHAKVTDGNAPLTIGGQPNDNVAGDLDGTSNGVITVKLLFSNQGFLQKTPGHYYFHFTSPHDDFAPTSHLFTVLDTGYSQSITGNVSCAGTNVGGAFVVLIPGALGQSSPVSAALTDSNGNYAVSVPSSTYSVMPVDPGYVTDMTSAQSANFGSGNLSTNNLTLLPATTFISGYCTNPPSSMPKGMLALAISADNQLGAAFSDTNGTFSIGVSSNTWQLQTDSTELAPRGFLQDTNNFQLANTTTGSVAGVVMPFTSGNALFYGRVTDDSGLPVVGMQMKAQPPDGSRYETYGMTDTNGQYYVAVIGGSNSWSLGLSSDFPLVAQYLYSQIETNMAQDQATRADFTCLHATNQITGHVHDETGAGIPDLNLSVTLFTNNASYNQETTTDNTGAYSLNVIPGSWFVAITANNQGNSLTGYLSMPWAPVAITNPLTTLDFTLYHATNTIQGHVLDNHSNPLTNLQVSASVMLGGQEYAAGAMTDDSGAFTINVSTGRWSLSLDAHTLQARNYVSAGQQQVEVSSTNATLNFTVLQDNAQVSGVVTNSSGQGITNITVYASTTLAGHTYNASAITDAGGTYVMNVVTGTWTFTLDHDTLFAQNYSVPVNVSNNITAGPNFLNFMAWPLQPTIFLQPQDVTTNSGSNITFSVMAYGNAYLTYQWQREGTNIANNAFYWNADRETLEIHFATPEIAGHYRVIVSNQFGVATSSNALLTVVVDNTPLGVAVNNTNLAWTTGGHSSWAVDSTTSHDGISALHSGPISFDQATWLQTTIPTSGNLSFWWNVSSEAGHYLLVFAVDTIPSNTISGVAGGWQYVSTHISGTNAHLLKWTYQKDNAISTNSADMAWLDQVTWTPDVPFSAWMQIHSLAGNPATFFSADRNSDGVANGFEYAYGTNWSSGPSLNIRVANGHPVAELPAQEANTTPFVSLFVDVTPELTGTVAWSSAAIAANSTGKPANRIWFDAPATTNRSYFRARAVLLP